MTDFQRQYFDELQIQFQPGVGTTGLSVTPTAAVSSNTIYLGLNYTITSSATLSIPDIAQYIIGAVASTTDLTTTTNPKAMLRWSNDGGSTWSKEYWVSIGQLGKFKNRAIWRRLGMARDRVFEVAVSDPVNAVIVSANLKSTSGEN